MSERGNRVESAKSPHPFSIRGMDVRMWGATVSAIVFGLVMVVLCIAVADSGVDRCLNIAILMVALASGWLLGVVASPYNNPEAKRFASYTKVISAIVSGYVLGKLDRVIERAVESDQFPSAIESFRMMLFVAALIVAVLVTHAYRSYGSGLA
jgi:predicted secreted protein